MEHRDPIADGEAVTLVEFGFVERRSGLRVGLSRRENVDDDYCNDATYTLEDPRLGYPPFSVGSEHACAVALAEDVQWYNSSDDRPCWGSYKPGDLEAVRVETTMRITRTAMPTLAPMYLARAYVMDAGIGVIRSLDRDLAGLLPTRRYVLSLVHEVEGSPDLATLAGNVADFDRYGGRRERVVAVLPLNDVWGAKIPDGAQAATLVTLRDDAESPIEPYCTWSPSHLSPAP